MVFGFLVLFLGSGGGLFVLVLWGFFRGVLGLGFFCDPHYN